MVLYFINFEGFVYYQSLYDRLNATSLQPRKVSLNLRNIHMIPHISQPLSGKSTSASRQSP
jgi:hypothetical protein